MRTENIADLMPRLRKLQEHTGYSVNLSLEVWIYRHSEEETEWSCYLASEKKHFKAPTAVAAVEAAESALGIGPRTPALAAVVLHGDDTSWLAEYDAAAEWCVVNGLAWNDSELAEKCIMERIPGRDGDQFPVSISARCWEEITGDPDAFRDRVFSTAYALASKARGEEE